jgi:hypothetical protein
VTCRAWLKKSITTHGGDYRGALTKDVTHLIANAPTGKKYEHAERWHIRVVSLCWFKDCIDRGMVVDESPYHPFEEQEKAQNREAKAEALLRKRPRYENSIQEAPQKRWRTTAPRSSCSHASQGAPSDSHLRWKREMDDIQYHSRGLQPFAYSFQEGLLINELPPDFYLELSQQSQPSEPSGFSQQLENQILAEAPGSQPSHVDLQQITPDTSRQPEKPASKKKEKVLYWRWKIDYDISAFGGVRTTLFKALLTVAHTTVRLRVDYQNQVAIDGRAQGWRIKLRRCMDNLELEVLVEWTDVDTEGHKRT